VEKYRLSVDSDPLEAGPDSQNRYTDALAHHNLKNVDPDTGYVSKAYACTAITASNSSILH